VRLRNRIAVLMLTDEAREILRAAGIEIPDSISRIFQVDDHDDMGVWVREPQKDGDHIVLREYILTVDVLEGETGKPGMR